VLTYDPDLHVLIFDYHDSAGKRRALAWHTGAKQWIPSGQDQLVPKASGPHTQEFIDRAVGDMAGQTRQWTLSALNTIVYNERTGTDDAGQPISSFLDGGWYYPAGPNREFHIFDGSLYHSHWGVAERCDLEMLVRRDKTGIIQIAKKSGVALTGARISNFYISRGGQSLRIQIKRTGKTSTGSPIMALGPLIFEGEDLGEVTKE